MRSASGWPFLFVSCQTKPNQRTPLLVLEGVNPCEGSLVQQGDAQQSISFLLCFLVKCAVKSGYLWKTVFLAELAQVGRTMYILSTGCKGL
ncbi:hypothetical protein BDV38DRAFT_254181 [Aspergillus pseudotamarii]|uniref:Uncharacterized protein n=1 Tax=Aspergillus pseudotamarii TaxID=132259 RepID=A0A5N6SJB7_ASPPS|nr:uncharacterized protein BDV38DRAFT_254181 [Aspergillus pseudotamarii]KAE8134776.1 hypothetical protein BDV38DRAFT_254181 [Aspergillus pseudotamarii]